MNKKININNNVRDISKGPVFKIDPSGSIVSANTAARKALGYSREKILKLSIFDFDNYFTETNWPKIAKKLFAGKLTNYQSMHKCKDGTTFPVECSVNVINDGNNNFISLSSRNVSDHTFNEMDLGFLNLAIDNSEDAIYIDDKDGNIHYVNQAACEALGYSRNELLSMKTSDIDPNWNIDDLQKFLRRAKTRKKHILETVHKRKDGTIFPVEITYNLQRYKGKEFSCSIVRDITERKKAEKHTQLINFALEKAMDSIYIFDETGQFIYANSSACQSTGYKPGEITSLSIFDLTPSISRNSWKDRLQQNLKRQKEGKHIRVEDVHQRRDGSRFPIEITVNYADFEGLIYGFAVARDITKRKKSETQRDELLFAIENSFDAFFMTATDGSFRYVNKQACESLGYTFDELMSMNVTQIDESVKLVDGHVSIDSQTDAMGQARTFESFHRRKDGSTFPVEVTYNNKFFDGIEYSFAFIRDITKRKKAERQRDELQYAIDNAVDALFLTTTDGKIRHVNKRACELLGYSYMELTSMNVSDIDENVKQDPDFSNIRNYAYFPDRSGAVESMQRRKDGTTFPVEVTFSNKSFEGVEYSFAFIRDITERKKEDRKRDELQAALENAIDAVYLNDGSGNIYYANKSASHMLGYEHEEFLSLNVIDIDPDFSIEALQGLINENNYSATHESWHRKKDGSMLPVEVTFNSRVYEGIQYYCTFVRDITERKQAQRQNEQLRFVVDNATDAVYIYGEDRNIIYANESATSQSGYSNKELLKMSIVDLDPNFNMEDRRAFWKTPGTNKRILSETTHYRKDGTIYPVEISLGLTIFDGTEYYSAFVRDITERKKARRRAEEMAFVVDNSIDAICIYDREAKIRYVNESMCRSLGYSRDELLSMTVFDLDPSVTQEWFDNDWKRREQGERQFIESNHCRKDGTSFPVEISISSTTIDGIVHACAFIRDITDRKKAMRQMEELQFAVENVMDPIYFYNDKADITYANRKACEVLGYSFEEIINLKVHDIDPHITPEVWKTLFPDVKASGGATLESTNRRKDGTEFPVEVTATNMTFGELEFGCSVNRDITERIQAQKALRDSEERFRFIADTSPVALVISRVSDDAILYANKQVESLFDNKINKLIGSPVSILFTNTSPQYDIKNVLTSEEQIYHCEIMLTKQDNNQCWLSINAKTIILQGEQAVCTVMLDITEAHELSRKLSYQAMYDALTGLVNRHEFESRLERVINTARQDQTENALCYLDLDQFKVINDTCGHIAGDELLRQLGQVLQLNIRKRDTLARLGGDEFAVLLENCSLQQAERVANTIRQSIQDFRFAWDDKNFNIGVSIGLVPITAGSESITDILRRVDTACYTAKDKGRNRIHIYSPDDEELARRHGEMQWVARLNVALEKEQLQVWSQKIVPINDDLTQGQHYELLLRMEDNDGTTIAPGAFLPAAERYNLSPRIDRWMINTIFNWFSQYPDKLDKLTMCSINLSGQSLSSEELLQEILRKFSIFNLPPSKFCFEITETSAIANLSSATHFISTLKEQGCRFALDDFGSGLSSFGYLKNLPVDYLKIDGLFVKDILVDPIDLAMVKSINDIGHVMGKKTIAEFVESQAILEKLREVGVDYAQGYGIEKPKLLTKRDMVPN